MRSAPRAAGGSPAGAAVAPARWARDPATPRPGARWPRRAGRESRARSLGAPPTQRDDERAEPEQRRWHDARRPEDAARFARGEGEGRERPRAARALARCGARRVASRRHRRREEQQIAVAEDSEMEIG